jgi:hypothetical protein
MQALQQQIETARRERQTYLEELRRERPVHTMPWFVRERRQIAETGRALVTVEKQLDTLQAALEQAQQRSRAQQAPASAQGAIIIDNTGRDSTYWRRRLTEVRDRLRQAQEQRRDILDHLGSIADDEDRTAQRQGRTILQQADTLLQVEQEIDAAEVDLQVLTQEALQAGAPIEWLQ